ncbi:TetR/AcrR family transcriptional regulator [Streptomyces sp. A1547]|uniref:TetR/AcrR family transcriptional regulator n=1 Tax=Streptomyces sp. A1547 TaxID=2563105 RepID=UPI00061FEED3|nr:TetR/AcrR family transcriptional regulator [Streptomyces sp. A1547]KJY46088.1 TetR family transcriptional regulator [Streptomyces sp. NRRL S-444]THA40123.1 TetR/AcrR family transcriptional regulator [Streptomyces sp. A1547]
MEQHSPLRERLIDVGVDLVLTEGTAALGLREIARRAGVSHGAPRRYFPTHHSLLSAIARRGFADLGGRFAAATAGAPSPREQVKALGCAYVGYALEHRGMFELMFRHDLLDSEGQESAGPSDTVQEDSEQEDSGQGTSGKQPRLRESTLPLFRLLVGLVSRCRAGGDPEVTAAALWANLHGVAQLWAWGSLPLVLGDTAGHRAGVERLVDAALDAHLGAVPA